MTADHAARVRALDTSGSFLVQAPAGSGKTELLIQRFLALLNTVDEPDAVVAITFTRKAAAEMRARVMAALRSAESGVPPEAEHERVTFEIARRAAQRARTLHWNLLENPARLRIETIDALCAFITRRMPWLARFGAMPEISERADDLYREAARRTLSRAETHSALAEVLLHLDNDFQAAERLIVRMLARRDQWLPHTGAAAREHLQAALEDLIESRLQTVREALGPGIVRELAVLTVAEPASLEDWKTAANQLLTQKGDWRRRVDKHRRHLSDLIARLRGNEAAREALHGLDKLPSPHISDAQWQTMQAVVSVLNLAVAELQLVFAERERIDFAELGLRASEALGLLESPSDLALALGYHIRHILVDEFQDTSYAQYALIEKLTADWQPGDGRTLFLVGDPMQSIYRFREADVSLLLQARDRGIGAIRFEPLELTINFRSDPRLVAWANTHFARILPAQDDAELGAVKYSSSVSESTPGDARVEVHALLDRREEAARVLELLNAHPDGKTAILVRTRQHAAEIVAALKRNRIPFQAIEIDQLGERAVVQDLIALTFALLHPADRVSWLAILRAPWCGLTLEDLHALAASDRETAVWDLLHRSPGALSVDGAARVQRILPALEKAHAERGRRPLRDWVECVWLRLGGPAYFDETALADASAYFDLLEGLQRGADLDDFEWFRRQVDELFAHADTRAGDRLQLMTIHKAKGLEFDTVILPGLGERAGSDPPSLLLWTEHAGRLLLAPIAEAGSEKDPLYRYIEQLERSKAEHELARLLYVGATRARRNLHLLGSVRIKPDGSIGEPQAGSFLKLLWPMVEAKFRALPTPAAVEPTAAPRLIRRVRAECEAPVAPPGVHWSRRDVEPMQPPSVRFAWAGESVRRTGTALHGFLQRIATEGLDAWSENVVRERRGLYRSVLGALGVPPAELHAAAERVEAGLIRTLRDPRGRWILEPHAEAECEYSIAGIVDGKLIEAAVDRTFIEDGVRWIVDYKTSEHEGGDVEAFLDNERMRYQEQLERYARLLFASDQRPIRLALYFPLLGGWREWPAPVLLRKLATQASLFEL